MYECIAMLISLYMAAMATFSKQLSGNWIYSEEKYTSRRNTKHRKEKKKTETHQGTYNITSHGNIDNNQMCTIVWMVVACTENYKNFLLHSASVWLFFCSSRFAALVSVCRCHCCFFKCYTPTDLWSLLRRLYKFFLFFLFFYLFFSYLASNVYFIRK